MLSLEIEKKPFKKEKESEGNPSQILYSFVKNPKEILLMDELHEEILIRNTLTEDQIINEKHIRALAVELASQEKYDNYFATHKFSGRWMLKFRRLFNIPYIRPGKTLTGIKR